MKWIVVKENWKTTKHKFQIIRFMMKVCFRLMRRAWVHDLSKYSKKEAPLFAAAQDTKGVVYGSEEYKKDVEVNLKPALDHHYMHNSHHPQHHSQGFKGMQPLDVIEMLIDWKASTLRYKDSKIQDSLANNKERYNISEQDIKNFEKFYREIKAW